MIFFMTACSPVRYVGDGQYLLNKVKIMSNDKAVSRSALRRGLTQKPNTKILGLVRFHLGLYNMSGSNNEKRINKWLRSIGEEPVIFDKDLSFKSVDQLKSIMNDNGFYHAHVVDTAVYKNKRAVVSFYVYAGERTTISDYVLHDYYHVAPKQVHDTTRLLNLFYSDSVSSSLKVGAPLSMSTMTNERDRVYQSMRENGYYAYTKEMLHFYVDTTYSKNPLKARVYETIRVDDTEKTAFEKYHIDKIRIYSNFDQIKSLNDSTYKSQCVVYKGVPIFYDKKLKIKPKILIDNLKFKTGDVYNSKRMTETYSKYQSLDLFKYINMSLLESDSLPMLDCDIQLTPMKRQSYNIFIEGTNNSGNIGVGGNFSYNHKNIFGGAENLTISIWGALKKEQIKEDNFFSTTEFGVEIKVVTPQFWFPLFKGFKRDFSPKTSISLSYSTEHTPYYDRNVAAVKFGYYWSKTNNRVRYILDPIDLNYVSLNNVDTNFINGLRNEYYKSAYTDHLILSSNFSLIFSNQRTDIRSSYSYLRCNLETSGNLLRGISAISRKNKVTNNAQSYYEALGVRYAEFVKLDAEYRYIHNISPIHSLVYRLFLGCAYPYGNMKVMPFEEAYYCGGSNDIRAWHSRTLGPGAFDSQTTYPNSVGDVKMEANVEYRFKLFWMLEGALFVDAGNIWNINKMENRRGARLTSDFYKQIALGVGPGLRLDVNYFLIRLDWGIKLHDPVRNKGSRFVLIHNGRWVKNTIINIAIGYPF